jgi:hypothetical protein
MWSLFIGTIFHVTGGEIGTSQARASWVTGDMFLYIRLVHLCGASDPIDGNLLKLHVQGDLDFVSVQLYKVFHVTTLGTMALCEINSN